MGANHGRKEDAGLPETRRETERLATLGTLLACVAHEINNPVTYVLGNLAELRETLDTLKRVVETYRSDATVPDTVHEAIEEKFAPRDTLELAGEILDDALVGSERIRDVVRDLPRLANPVQGGIPDVDPHEVIESSLGLMGRRLAAVARIRCDLSARQRVAIDPARLAGVILNLLSNALQACRPADPERHCITVRTRDGDGRVEIEVEDSGSGIAPEDHEQIFTPFFTTKSEGHGLGLFFSRTMIEESGGSLDFRPSEHGGTIFSIRVPATDGDQSGGNRDGDARD